MVALFAKLRKWSNPECTWTKWQQLSWIAERNKIHSHYNSYWPPQEPSGVRWGGDNTKHQRNNVVKTAPEQRSRCWSVMNAFLWALDKSNFHLGKEHICWLKLLSLRILVRVCLAKQNNVLWTSTVPRPTAFQRGHSWSATHAPRVAGWVFVVFCCLIFTWINPFILASFLCPSSRQTRSWPSSVSPPQDLLEEHRLGHQFFLPWTQHT